MKRALGKAVRLSTARHAQVVEVAGSRPVQDVVDELLDEALRARAEHPKRPVARARPEVGARAASRGQAPPSEPTGSRQVTPRWKANQRG